MLAEGISIKDMKDEKTRRYYLENVSPDYFYYVAEEARKKGYQFNKESGLHLLETFDEKTIKSIIKRTLIQVIFNRITDFHDHEDVTEAVRVLNGAAEFYACHPCDLGSTKPTIKTTNIYKWDTIIIPRYTPHAFNPQKGSIFEILVACSGILDEKKEKCIIPFQEFDPNDTKKYTVEQITRHEMKKFLEAG